MAFSTCKTQHFILALLIAGSASFMACDSGKTRNAGNLSGAQSASADQGAAASNNGTGSASISTQAGTACGFEGRGRILHVGDGIDVCEPPTTCTSEVCPPALGSCNAGQCVFKGTYRGLKTLPEAWATYYCTLTTGGCDGITQVNKVSQTAAKLSSIIGAPLCEGAAANAACVGIAASSPRMVGNSQVAVDASTGLPVRPWGLGLSEAAHICYRLGGPGGEVYVALTDRCGGYCKCGGSSYQECGPCVNAKDMQPSCPCVGTAPGIADVCCGANCPEMVAACDWCASNNHPHFDLDQATFNHLCGALAVRGSCKLTKVEPVACDLGVAWPPP